MFDSKTSHALGYYVYLLMNPLNSSVFYVGKGKGNRVFQHVDDIVDGLDQSVKLEMIKDIIDSGSKVSHIILRHGLNDKEAFELEAGIIDFIKFIDGSSIDSLSNIQGGVDSQLRGLMNVNEVKRTYQALPLDYIAPECMIININRTYGANNNLANGIYHATKEIWRLNKGRLPQIKYVLSEYQGRIVEVFEVHHWYEKLRPYNKGSKKYGKTYIGYGFEGAVAPREIRNQYLNKSIAHHKKRGAANVIRYNL